MIGFEVGSYVDLKSSQLGRPSGRSIKKRGFMLSEKLIKLSIKILFFALLRTPNSELMCNAALSFCRNLETANLLPVGFSESKRGQIKKHFVKLNDKISRKNNRARQKKKKVRAKAKSKL